MIPRPNGDMISLFSANFTRYSYRMSLSATNIKVRTNDIFSISIINRRGWSFKWRTFNFFLCSHYRREDGPIRVYVEKYLIIDKARDQLLDCIVSIVSSLWLFELSEPLRPWQWRWLARPQIATDRRVGKHMGRNHLYISWLCVIRHDCQSVIAKNNIGK